MRAMTTILGGLALLAGGAWAGMPAKTADDGKPAWLTDFAAAQEQARREQRPILAVLH
jgi:hypothetical protein